MSLSDTVAPGQASVPLIDYTGSVISYVVWDAPRPGASILRKAAIPLALALGVATAISAISSLYAVRSARRLERALIAAKAADRSRTEFLSNVSHELRTPMNGVLGATQLLEITELDDEQRELVGLLMSSATAQMSLISDLIDVSRINSGNRKLEVGAVRAGGGSRRGHRHDEGGCVEEGDPARDRLARARGADRPAAMPRPSARS